jgi:hypothetical protein
MNEKLAESLLRGLHSMDQPLGRLMETAKGLDGSGQKSLIDISGELLRTQFDLIKRLIEAFPDLDLEDGRET